MKTKMKTSEKGLKLIKESEGLRLNKYLDIAGKPTIGYGHLITNKENYQTISLNQANELLKKDVEKFENYINKYCKVDLSQNEFDAIVSLMFNVGSALLYSKSWKLLNKGYKKIFADRILLWNKAVIKGVLKPIYGLTLRRQKERLLFLNKL